MILFSRHPGLVSDQRVYVALSQDPVLWLRSLVLPAAMLSLFQIGFLARMTRSAMLDVLSQDFIRTARSKGLSEWKTVGKHAFRNALIMVITAHRHSCCRRRSAARS